MTIWKPEISESAKNKYVAIADAIGEDVVNAKLQPGQQLPTQRELAKFLGVTVGTIGRAYALAEKRGLISPEIGRGSFVRSFESRSNELGNRQGVIDLGLNLPPITQHHELLARTLAQISHSRDIVSLFGNAPVESYEHHRVAAAKWLSDRVDCSAADTVICSGTQNALVAALSSLTNPNDSVLVEELTFPGMIVAANLLRLNLIPVKMDRLGIIPGELERAAKKAKVLYCVPTNHNPTMITMSTNRRMEIARIVKKKNLYVVEDDVYGKLIEGSPEPLAALVPNRTLLITSLAKTLSVGLRLAFVRTPFELRETLLKNMRASNFFPAPLLSEVATRWINDETAERLLQEQRKIAKLRQSIAKEILPEKLIHGESAGHHVWLNLPAAWSAETLERAARENGVKIYAAELFVPADDAAPNSVRIALGAARNESELRIGLKVIARLLSDEVDDSAARY